MGNEAICSEKAELIKQGRTSLGIEFGSTRIKAVLVDFSGEVLGVGFHDWENSLTDGIWTYPLDEIHAGLKKCYTSLRKNVEVWSYPEKNRLNGHKCHDAWTYGV